MESSTYDETPENKPTPLVKGKPSKAERKAANRAKRDAVTLQEYARAEVPEEFRPAENQAAQGPPPVTGLLTAEERRRHQKVVIDQLRGTGILTRGRPDEYTEDEADAICAWVAGGGSLKAYSRQTGRPMITVYRWMRERSDFHARYSRAHEDRADTLADDGLEIVDAAAVNPSIEGVAAAKLRWEARKWIASKLRPNKWGDKQTVEHKGAVNIRIGVTAKPSTQVIEDATIVGDAAGTPRQDGLLIGQDQ